MVGKINRSPQISEKISDILLKITHMKYNKKILLAIIYEKIP